MSKCLASPFPFLALFFLLILRLRRSVSIGRAAFVIRWSCVMFALCLPCDSSACRVAGAEQQADQQECRGLDMRVFPWSKPLVTGSCGLCGLAAGCGRFLTLIGAWRSFDLQFDANTFDPSEARHGSRAKHAPAK